MSAVLLPAAVICLLTGLGATLVLRRRLELVARAEHELRGPATGLSLACETLRRDPATRRHALVIEAQLDRLRAGLADLEAARGGHRPGGTRACVELGSVVQASLRPWRDWLGGAAFEWEGGPAPAILDRGRLAEALGNLVANAAEHGAGEVQVRGRRTARGVRIEVRNRVAAAGAVRSGGSASAQPRLGARPLAPPRLGAGPRSRDLARFPFRARPGSRPLVRPLFGAGLRSRPLALRPYRDRGRGLAIASRAARDLGGRLLLSFDGERAVAVLELPAAALAPSAGPSGAETA